MSEVDLAIIVGVGLSATLSFLRGIFREALSLFVWLAAILITLYFSRQFATILPIDSVQSQLARINISAVILFFGTLFVGAIFKWIAAQTLVGSRLGIADRLGGVVFGIGRGVIIVALLVLAANLVPELKLEQWWQDSKLIPHFHKAATFIHAGLPDTVGRHFDIN